MNAISLNSALKSLVLLGIIIYSNHYTLSQNYLLNSASNGTTVNTCGGTFYDSGGAGGNYGASDNFTITFCPDGSTGSHIAFDFSIFDVDANILGADNMIIYDGPNTSSPQLGTYNNNFSIAGTIVRATDGNVSGCLTFRFVANNIPFINDEGAGWEASIFCTYPCQTVNGALASSTPAIDGAYINICLGEEITFNGEGVYPQNGTHYSQSDATSTFEWDFGDGGTATGASAAHTYSQTGGHRVNLKVTDVNGCISSNVLGVFVQIPEPFNFNGTSASQYTICYDETTQLTGVATPVEWQEPPPPPAMDTMFLPDGTGVCYEPQIEYEIFQAGSTLTDISQIINVWAIMEHSYVGDLAISIICPNGQEVFLHNQNTVFLTGLSANLGEPGLGVNDNNPGVGYEYVWPSNGASYGTIQQEATGQGTNYSLPAGTYTSEQPLSGLLGCPLNGVWKLKICDTQTQDNGFVFGFGLTFDSNLFEWSFEPEVVSTEWLNNTGLTQNSATTATVGPFQPSEAGNYDYTFTVTDDFGCTTDTTITITVLPPSHPSCGGTECVINAIDLTVEDCVSAPFLQYNLTGEVHFSNPPNSGQLIIQNCFGQQQVFSAPFTSPTLFSFTDLPQNGELCQITATFTDESLCTFTEDFYAPPGIIYFDVECIIGGGGVNGTIEVNNPAQSGNLVIAVFDGTNTFEDVIPMPATGVLNWEVIGLDPAANPYVISYYFDAFGDCAQTMTINCGCAANAGTTVSSMSGQSTNEFQLCYGDEITILSNNDYSFPDDDGPLNGFPYQPALLYLVYTCPPSPGVFPANDPCFLTVWESELNLTDVNNQNSILNQLGGPAVLGTNTLYFTPITLYHYTPGGPYIVNANCWGIGPVTQVVYTTPVVASTVGDQLNCGGNTGEVSASATGGTPPYVYFWQNDLGIGQTHPVSPNQTTSYDVTVVDANGCTDDESATVVVNPFDQVIAGEDVVVCEGEMVTLSAQGSGNYVWQPSVTNGQPFMPNVGIQVYTVTATDANGCVSTDDLQITVHQTPAVFAGNDINVCATQTAILTATGAETYVWDNNVVNGQPFVPNETGVYTVVGTSQFGCINSDQVVVTVNPLPDVTISGSNLNGCAPLTPVFSNLSATGNESCVWSFSNGTSITGCNNVSQSFVNPGCYDVTLTVTSSSGCISSSTIQDYVCVYPNPIADFWASPNQLTTLNSSSNLINSSVGATSYHWDFGDGTVSNDVNPTHVFPNEYGDYVVKLVAISEHGCRDTTYQTIRIIEELIFYVPNAFTPDNDQFNEVFKPVFTEGFDPFNYHLTIFNRWGEIVFESFNAEVGWDGTYGGNIVQDGTYIWKIIFKRNFIDDRESHIGHVVLIR